MDCSTHEVIRSRLESCYCSTIRCVLRYSTYVVSWIRDVLSVRSAFGFMSRNVVKLRDKEIFACYQSSFATWLFFLFVLCFQVDRIVRAWLPYRVVRSVLLQSSEPSYYAEFISCHSYDCFSVVFQFRCCVTCRFLV